MNTPPTYRELVLALESKQPVLLDVQTRQLLHAAIGLATESGELLDALKKHLFYGKPLDYVNVHEELGDLRFYLELAYDAAGTCDAFIKELNTKKLLTRYKAGKFSQEEALTRDLQAERTELEKVETPVDKFIEAERAKLEVVKP